MDERVKEKAIQDVNCEHRSRWIWTPTLAKWMNVVLAPNCDCGDPAPDWPECDAEAMEQINKAEVRRG